MKYEVCPVCEGEGKHVNPAIDSDGLDDEAASDPDFMEEYMSGTFDVACRCCNGARVVTAASLRAHEDNVAMQREMLAEQGIRSGYDARGY